MKPCPDCGTHRRPGACPHCGSDRTSASFGAAAAVLGLLLSGCGEAPSLSAAGAAVERALAGGSYVDPLIAGGTAYGLTFTDSADSGTPPTDSGTPADTDTDTDADSDTDADTDADSDTDTDADTDADTASDTADTGGGKPADCSCATPTGPGPAWLGAAAVGLAAVRRRRR